MLICAENATNLPLRTLRSNLFCLTARNAKKFCIIPQTDADYETSLLFTESCGRIFFILS